MSNIFYTSDLHIGHKRVSEIRGFIMEDEFRYVPDKQNIDTDAHDEALAREWDKTVRNGDQVFVLGDISINGGQHALDWIAERPGIKHLIAGNHDPVHPQFRTAPAKYRHWLDYFETIHPFARRKLYGKSFLLSHYPYWSWGDGPDRHPARDEQWRLPDLGLPLLHGHTHGTEREHGNMFHVGWDAWHQLVPQETIQEWLLTLD